MISTVTPEEGGFAPVLAGPALPPFGGAARPS
jgi:hypothetical protein